MIIRNATKEDIDAALADANFQYSQNICARIARHNAAGTVWQVELTVRSVRGDGARPWPRHYTDSYTRKNCAVTWDAQKAFIEALPNTAHVVAHGIKRHPSRKLHRRVPTEPDDDCTSWYDEEEFTDEPDPRGVELGNDYHYGE